MFDTKGVPCTGAGDDRSSEFCYWTGQVTVLSNEPANPRAIVLCLV